MKRLCAKAALDLVPDHGIIGLGGGETISYLAEDIKEAACVILSTDVAIQGEERFHGKKVMRMGVQDLMKKAEPIMKKIKETFDK